MPALPQMPEAPADPHGLSDVEMKNYARAIL
jgi:hypothetical protein